MTGKQSLFRFRAGASRPRSWRLLCAGMSLLLMLAACDRRVGVQMTAESDEPHFRRGLQALRGNQNQVALEAFQKVIDKRQGDAPQSHLEIGRIYLEHMKDPLPAIYHFRRYLEFQPNGLQAPQVTQMIETAQKEFARRLPGNPLGPHYEQLDLKEQIDKLLAENSTLRAELDRLTRSGRSATNPAAASAAARPAPSRVEPVVPASSAWTNAISDAGPAPEVVPVSPEGSSATAAAAVRQPPRAPTDSGRVYVVQKGDTLVGISRKIYGSPSQWHAIYDVNRERIPDVNSLKIGTQLKLP